MTDTPPGADLYNRDAALFADFAANRIEANGTNGVIESRDVLIIAAAMVATGVSMMTTIMSEEHASAAVQDYLKNRQGPPPTVQ